jgi:hypothetical protein
MTPTRNDQGSQQPTNLGKRIRIDMSENTKKSRQRMQNRLNTRLTENYRRRILITVN